MKRSDPGPVRDLLLPELAALAAVDPVAARERGRRMRADAFSFCRGTLALHAAWMAREVGFAAPWTWCVGDPHPGNLMVIAAGPRGADGRIRAAVDWADVDDELACPWDWDAVRLLAACAMARPDLGRAALLTLSRTMLDAYRARLELYEPGAKAWRLLAGNGLPAPVAAAVAAGDDDEARHDWTDRQVRGHGKDARLARADRTADDPIAAASLLPALRAAWADAPRHRVLDLARRVRHAGVASRGRRRWLALVREHGRDGTWHRRLVELKERRPSTVSRHVPVCPFGAPGPGTRPWTTPMAGDPFQRLLNLPAGDVLARTRCHARSEVELAGLDAADLARAMAMLGICLARFHLAAMEGLGLPAGAIAARLAADAARTRAPAQAWALATACRSWHAEFLATRA